MKENIDENNKGNCYNKIKYLVEVDDDVLAVFTMISFQIRNLYIARNSKLDNRSVDLIVNDLGYNKDGDMNSTTAEVANNTNKNLLGKIKWMVLEYDNLRILKIYESDKIILF